MKRPFVIGIAGPTGSGKSTLALSLAEKLSAEVVVVHMDDYFINPVLMPLYDGEHNYDDPRAIDIKQLLRDVRELRQQKPPNSVIIVEGFLVLHFTSLRRLFDFSIFLSAPLDLLLMRRVHHMPEHYRTHVIGPMYEKYVKPTSRYADYIFDVSIESKEKILERAVQMLPFSRP